MSQSTLQKPKGKAEIRRRVRRDYRAGDQVGFKTKSFSKDDGTEYHPVIDETTGEFHCDCPDHFYRKNFCKHIRRAAAQLQMNTTLRTDAPHCFICNGAEQLHPLAHEDGTLAHGAHLCCACATELRDHNEHWSDEANALREQIGGFEAKRDALVEEESFWAGCGIVGNAHELEELQAHIFDLWREYMKHEPLPEGDSDVMAMDALIKEARADVERLEGGFSYEQSDDFLGEVEAARDQLHVLLIERDARFPVLAGGSR